MKRQQTVNEKDEPIGLMPKMEAHEKALLHRAFSVFILNSDNEIMLQQRAAEKRFRRVVGATPKKFSSIIRLQTALNNYGKCENLTDLGYSAGYFDQSHFIKDFKQFTGETPEKFFSGTIK